MEWWPITKSSEYPSIEWSPTGKVRVHIIDRWYYTRCSKASFAELTAYEIIMLVSECNTYEELVALKQYDIDFYER